MIAIPSRHMAELADAGARLVRHTGSSVAALARRLSTGSTRLAAMVPSRAGTGAAIVVGCVALIALAAGTGPQWPRARDCPQGSRCGSEVQAAAFPQRSSAPTIPVQGPGVAAPVPLQVEVSSLADNQAWANSAPPIPPRQKPKPRDDSFAGAMQSLGRGLASIFR